MRILRGPRLISAGKLTSRLHGWKYFFCGWTDGLRVGDAVLPRHLECEHILILGAQGYGKSTLVSAILKQVEARGETAIVVDPEGEFTRQFYQPKRGDWIGNPLDERGFGWTPWREFRDGHENMDIPAMVSSLVRGRPHNDTESFWYTKAKDLLEKLLRETPNLLTLR